MNLIKIIKAYNETKNGIPGMPALTYRLNMKGYLSLEEVEERLPGNQIGTKFDVSVDGESVGVYRESKKGNLIGEILFPNSSHVERVFLVNIEGDGYRNISTVNNIIGDYMRIFKELRLISDPEQFLRQRSSS